MAYSSNPFNPILEALRYAAELNERKKQEEEERKKWAQQLALQQQKAKSEENYWKQLLALRRREGESEREYKERLLALQREELGKKYPPLEEINPEDILNDPAKTGDIANKIIRNSGFFKSKGIYSVYDMFKFLPPDTIKETLVDMFKPYYSNNPDLLGWINKWATDITGYKEPIKKKVVKDEKQSVLESIGKGVKKAFTEAFSPSSTASANQRPYPPVTNKEIKNPHTGIPQKGGRKAIKFRNIIKKEKKKKPLESEITNWRDSSGATGSW